MIRFVQFSFIFFIIFSLLTSQIIEAARSNCTCPCPVQNISPVCSAMCVHGTSCMIIYDNCGCPTSKSCAASCK